MSLAIFGVTSFDAAAQSLGVIEERLPTQRERAPGGGEYTAQTPSSEPDKASNKPPAFVLSGVVMKGVTAFPLKEFAPLYDQYLATRISTAEMALIAQRITAKYRQAGYFLSRAVVPAQSVNSGILQIEVQEGYVSDVRIEAPAGWDLQSYFTSVMSERPLKLSTLERVLALVGDLNGVKVTKNSLEPIFDDPAAHRLVVVLDVDHASGYVYADNRGNDAVGPLQIYTSSSLNSVLSEGDQFSLGVFTVPDQPSELLYGEVSYAVPLSHTGTSMVAHGSMSRVDAGSSLADLDYEVDSQKIDLTLSHPLIRTRRMGLWANLGIAASSIKEYQLGNLQYRDAIRQVGGSLNFYDRHDDGVSRIFMEVSQGLPVAGASKGDGSDQISRPGVDVTFTRVYAEVSRYQSIGAAFGVYVAAEGQYAPNTLLASENLPLGGPDYGRAFDYWTISGEKGLAGQLELRYGRSPSPQWWDFYQLYAFCDTGAVWNEGYVDPYKRLSLSSAGGGVRLTFAKDLQLSYEFAVPIETPYAGVDESGRHFFSLSWTL